MDFQDSTISLFTETEEYFIPKHGTLQPETLLFVSESIFFRMLGSRLDEFGLKVKLQPKKS